MKHYAKKRSAVLAAQWTGEMSPEVSAVLGPRATHVEVGADRTLKFAGQQGYGRVAQVGDWIYSTSGEDLSLVGDEQFRSSYEEVDEDGRLARPTEDEHEAAANEFVRELDALLLAGLKLSKEEHPDIFRERERLMRKLRHLFEDQSYNASRRTRREIRERIVKDLTP